MANRVDPDHTDPSGTFQSGSTLFAYTSLSELLAYQLVVQPSKHVYMGPIWAESGHLSHSGPAWAPYRLFCPYKTYIGPMLVNFDQQTRIYGNHMGRFGAFIPFGSYLGPI